MRRVATGKGGAEAVALDGANQHHGRLAFVGRRLCISGVEFGEVVAADIGAQGFQFLIRKVSDEGGQAVGIEQLLANRGAVGGHQALLIAVDEVIESLRQKPLGVSLKQVVPRAAPQDLDDVPARTAIATFQFLDDFGVATNGAVKALQVAVHRHDDVVQALTACEREL